MVVMLMMKGGDDGDDDGCDGNSDGGDGDDVASDGDDGDCGGGDGGGGDRDNDDGDAYADKRLPCFPPLHIPGSLLAILFPSVFLWSLVFQSMVSLLLASRIPLVLCLTQF